MNVGQAASSTPFRVNKRPRSHSSPEVTADMGSEKVGDLTQSELLSVLGKLLDDKLDNKLARLATKEDLQGVTAKVSALVEENKLLSEEVGKLQRDNNKVMSRLVDLEARSRRNNLIFKGLKVGQNTTDFRNVVSQFCAEVLGHDKIWVNRAHPLGRDRKSIIAHIPQDSDIEYIMARLKTLKGTGYIIHRDYPQEIRVKRARLHAVRSEVERVTGKRRMPIVYDHLTIEGCRFTWEGKLRAGLEDGRSKLHSLLGRDFTEFLGRLAAGEDTSPGETGPPAAASAAGDIARPLEGVTTTGTRK